MHALWFERHDAPLLFAPLGVYRCHDLGRSLVVVYSALHQLLLDGAVLLNK